MNENETTHREHLSAFVDGELEQEQIRFLLRRLDHDADLRAAWNRYHLMGDGLRRELPALAGAHFAAGVLSAIGGAAVGGRRRWLQWSAGGAIAAGVAAMALMVAQPPAPASRTSPDLASTVAGQSAAATLPASAPTIPRWLSATPQAGQLTQPAAATYYPVGPGSGIAASAYARPTAPYLSGPQVRVDGDATLHPWLIAPATSAAMPATRAH